MNFTKQITMTIHPHLTEAGIAHMIARNMYIAAEKISQASDFVELSYLRIILQGLPSHTKQN